MGLALKVIALAVAVTLFVQRSEGSNISPSPLFFTALPPIEGLPSIPIDVNAPIPASLPNVSQIPPLLPPVNTAPVPETGTGKETPPTLSPNTSTPLPPHELVPPPFANTPPTLSPNTSPPLPAHELVPPPFANTPPTLSPNTSPLLPSHGLVPPPFANTPHNQDPINNSPKPTPVTPVTTPIPSSSPQKPPSVVPRSEPPSSLPNVAPTNIAPPLKPHAPEPVISTASTPPPSPLRKIDGMPVASPPNRKFRSTSPEISPPLKAPPIHKRNASSPHNNVAPLSSPESPPIIRPQAPASLPSHRHHHGKENITTSPPSSLHLPPPIHKRNASSPHNNVAPLSSPESPPIIRPQAPASLPSHRHHHGKENITTSPPSSLHLPPPIHKRNASSPHNNVAPLSSPESPPIIRPQAPASLPSHRHHHGKENITTSPPSSLHLPPPPLPPPPPIERDAFSPKPHAHSRKKGHAATPSPTPLSMDHVLPGSSPPLTPPPSQTSLPILSPKASPPGPSPSNTKRPSSPPIHALPPPPPNKDCSPLTCSEPYTNTPTGSPCGCVLPMQVGLRLGVALYTFFPLVSELAEEISIGVFMRQSQVRIMGANAASQDPEKTIVLIDLVPLGEKFDNTSAYLTADRFWKKQVVIHSSLFGNYEVLYVRYPGLPPSPPSSTNIVDGEPYFGHGDNGRSVKPLGVDVSGVHHKRNKLTGSVVAIIVLSASVVLVLSIAVFWVVLSKRRQCQQGSTPLATLPFLSKPSGIAASIVGSIPSSETLSIRSSMAPYTGSATTFSSSDIEKATDSFNATRVLGEGGFGRVYGGVLSDGTEVAVKVLKRDDQQGGREFLAEVEMLSRLHHRNLVKLIGICTEDRARCLVYEIVRNGSVESHLHGVDKDIAPLDWGSRLKIALGAARALAYLHEDSRPRVIHRDFKSSNILLEEDFTPKVSDFGLARTALEEENKHVSTRVMGTFGYVAPEYAMTGHLLVKSDVYSYGVVLLELLTGKKPVDMSQPPGRENLVSWVRPLLTNQQDLETIIDPSLGPDFPFTSIAKVSAIASMCVQPEVSHRPFMGEVVQALKLVCDVERELELRNCSSSVNMDHIDTQSPVSNYECGLDIESGYYSGSGSDIFRFKRLEKQDDGSFRRHSSSSPLRSERGDKVWHKLRRFSGGTVSEHGNKVRFWSGPLRA